jgi:hypothetical protein
MSKGMAQKQKNRWLLRLSDVANLQNYNLAKKWKGGL